MKKKQLNWHRIFGITLMDYFTRTGYDVELEVDLSLKRQLLDVVVIEKKGKGKKPARICAGLENLGRHNLITYKPIFGSWQVCRRCAAARVKAY